jgi:voltage-gated potassium channel
VSHDPLRAEEAPPASAPARARLHQVVFESDTPAGRAFDLALIGLVLLSVVVVSVETVRGMPAGVYRALRSAEWTLTVVFTVEYVLRLIAVRRPLAYAASFYGVVDLLAILPTYVSLVVPGAQALLVVRVLRLLRVFRVLKLSRFLSEAQTLTSALRASSRKIAVFLLTVSTLVVVIGSLMFVVEGPENGFTSIPTAMYWTVVTLTTVGYGDVSPRTGAGADAGVAGDDPRLRDHRGADGDRDGGADAGARAPGVGAGLPDLRGPRGTTRTPASAGAAGPSSRATGGSCHGEDRVTEPRETAHGGVLRTRG